MIFDSHVHTKYSTDCKENIEAIIHRSREINTGIVITDHYDFNCPVPEKFIFDISKFKSEYDIYRSNSLMLGIELGIEENYYDTGMKILSSMDFDYVLGSIHFLEGFDIFQSKLYEIYSKEEAYELYFKSMYNALKKDNCIDALAHIDYMARYAAYKDKSFPFLQYMDYLDEILKLIISKDITLELNTRRLGDALAESELRQLLRRYRELKGRYIVLGSDAHLACNVGREFKRAEYICDLEGIKIIYYKERKPQYIL